MKAKKIIYWISTGIISAIMLMSASMYIFDHEEISNVFLGLGFPVFIIYPLAIAKLLGITAILTRKVKSLTEWAYAGFFFDLLLAFGAHWFAKDGGFAPALVGIVLIMTSYFLGKEVRKN